MLRTAVIGIGSNSLRILVADIINGKLIRVLRDREGMRVFAALDEKRHISEEMIERIVANLTVFKQKALNLGAETVFLFATSAVRDCGNQSELAKEITLKTGLVLEVLSGEEEAFFSYCGAVESDIAGMIDIGGGSTEIVIGTDRGIEESVSLQLGAVRLYQITPITNEKEARKAIDQAEQILLPYKSKFINCKDRKWFGTGGTLTMASALLQKININDSSKVSGYLLKSEQIMKAICELAPMPVDQRKTLPYLRPQRADIAVHGLSILYACMHCFDLDTICVNEQGNLEGYLKYKFFAENKILPTEAANG